MGNPADGQPNYTSWSLYCDYFHKIIVAADVITFTFTKAFFIYLVI